MRSIPAQRGRETFSLLAELSRAVRCCQQEAAFCEGVTFSQFFILDLIAEHGDLKLAHLHQILTVDKSTTTRLINPLVKQGLIVRERSDHDARAVILKLTSTGREVHQRVWECLSGFIATLEMTIPENRRTQVYDGLKIFLRALQVACASGPCRL